MVTRAMPEPRSIAAAPEPVVDDAVREDFLLAAEMLEYRNSWSPDAMKLQASKLRAFLHEQGV